MVKIAKAYIKVPLIKKLLIAFALGTLFGMSFWYLESYKDTVNKSILQDYIYPFGTIFIQMLKMVVIPIVFFSLLQGASTLPISKLGKVGAKLIFLYVFSSFLSAAVGISIALWVSPGKGAKSQWENLMVEQNTYKILEQSNQVSSGIFDIIMNLFENPFSALSNSNFLGLIVFAILLGLGFSSVKEQASTPSLKKGAQGIFNTLEVVNAALHIIVTWIMEYAPIGVFALTTVNFGMYGSAIIGPYLKVVGGIILGIMIMIFFVYAILIKIFSDSPVKTFFKHIKEPMLTAFVTRSSAAALPVSMKVAVEKLKIHKDVASFALPMGATINMDGVCVHLPMFAILAANLFNIPLGPTELFTLVITTVLAAIGTGGIPGGSLMLLFIVLGGLGLSDEKTAIIVSLALGVNPILDMFETMNNVTGDLMCTYLIGRKKVS